MSALLTYRRETLLPERGPGHSENEEVLLAATAHIVAHDAKQSVSQYARGHLPQHAAKVS